MVNARRVSEMVVVSALAALLAPRAAAAAEPRFQGEAGIFGGAHLFSKKLELGQYDDPGNTTSPSSSPIVGLRLALSYQRWASLELEAGGMPTQDRRDDMTAFLATYRAHVLVHLLHGNFRPFVLAGAGVLQVVSTNGTETGLDTDTDAAVHAGLGMKYLLWDGLSVRLDGRVIVLPSTEEFGVTNDWELLVGFSYRFGLFEGPNAARPVVAAAKPAPPNPAPPTRKPLSPPVAVPVSPATDDDDGDGLTGAADKCPREAEDRDSFEDEDGCPDPDNDRDGIPDATDKCIDKLEIKNGFEDDDGCPDEAPPAAPVAEPTVMKGITFASGSAQVSAGSHRTLDAAVKVLKENPTMRVEVAGHTSDDGNRDANVVLSRKRAESVKAYFVRNGIDAGRIETVGHGSEKPLAPNITRRGREQNRRIEIRVVK